MRSQDREFQKKYLKLIDEEPILIMPKGMEKLISELRRDHHAFQKISDKCVIARPCSSPRLHHLPTVPESIESDFAPRGGTWLGISNVRTRQTKLTTIIASTTFSIAPTPRAERS